MPLHKATITSGVTSSAVDLGSGVVLAVGLYIPALTTSVAVTFTVADEDDDTFVPLYDGESGSAVSVAASTSAARAVALPVAWFAGWRYIKCITADSQTSKDFYFSVRS